MKKKNKGKGVIITLVLLIIICLACGTLGLLESKKDDKNNKNNETKDFQVTYRYYLDGEELDEPLEQDYITIDNPNFEGAQNEKPMYSFERYSCTKDVTGEWDEEEWTFKPILTANSTCRLYFLKNTHEVTFKANNGGLPSGQPEEKITAELDKESTINIKPNDGYKFDKIECSNGVETKYDETTNDITISNVKKDSLCTVSFKISDYVVEIKANNGQLENPTTKNVNYGDNAEFVVKPAENYVIDGTPSCTNGQKATYNTANNKVTISGITNDTTCTVNFKAQKHRVTLNIENGTADKTTQEVADGKTVTFRITPNEGYKFTNAKHKCEPTAKDELEGTINKYTVYNITSDLLCTITLTKDEATTPKPTE